jgi:glycosyltransferase involved in cell wall biosynthesis
MRISTIIPAYNCEQYLRRAVESLLATRYDDLEIVIVDDGSRDGTLAVAETLRDEHPELIRVQTHPDRANRGVSSTRNLGIESSTGELIAFLDADDYVHPWRFDSAVDILKNQADVDAVHQLCELQFADCDSASTWWEGQTLFGFARPIAAEDILFSLLNGVCWATSAILARRALLAETGMFDPRFRICEDCHLWFRLAYLGRVVSGDLDRPVSVYWRHQESAYQPSALQRLPMIRAMSAFISWIKARTPHDPRLTRVKAAVADYLFRGLEEARLGRKRKVAFRLATEGAYWLPELCRHRRFYGNLARLAVGR